MRSPEEDFFLPPSDGTHYGSLLERYEAIREDFPVGKVAEPGRIAS